MSYIKGKSFKIVSRFYVIYGDYEPIYLGYTNRTVKQRFREHQKDKDFSDYDNVEVKELIDEKLSFDFTWDYEQTCKNADEVSLREGQLVQQYGTQDSVFQKADGGGQTWATEKGFVKCNRDNPRFEGMSGTEIKRLIKEEEGVTRWLSNFVNDMRLTEECWLKDFVGSMRSTEEVWLDSFVSTMKLVEEQWLGHFVSHIKPVEETWLQGLVNTMKPIEEKWVVDFVNCMKPVEEVWLSGFVKNIKLIENRWLNDFISHIKPTEEVWLDIFVGNMKPVEEVWLSNFLNNMKPIEGAWLNNFVGGMAPTEERWLKDFVGNMKNKRR